jgi:hypothetical protein
LSSAPPHVNTFTLIHSTGSTFPTAPPHTNRLHQPCAKLALFSFYRAIFELF